MKKFGSILLASTCSVMLLAGCGQDNSVQKQVIDASNGGTLESYWSNLADTDKKAACDGFDNDFYGKLAQKDQDYLKKDCARVSPSTTTDTPPAVTPAPAPADSSSQPAPAPTDSSGQPVPAPTDSNAQPAPAPTDSSGQAAPAQPGKDDQSSNQQPTAAQTDLSSQAAPAQPGIDDQSSNQQPANTDTANNQNPPQ